MGIFSDVLFTSDFDHTISDKHNRVNPINVEAIRYFMDNGGLFCLNSGRSVPLLRCRLGEIPVNAPCLCYNGAGCYDFKEEKMLWAHALPDSTEELIEKVRTMDLPLCMEIQGVQTHYEIGEQMPSRLRFLREEGFEPVFDADTIPKPWMKLVVCGATGEHALEDVSEIPPEELKRFSELEKEIRAFCGDRYFVTRSMPRLLEISNPGCDKGRAARDLAKMLGRSVLVCAGDAPNDERMLREGDYAFCPTDAEKLVLDLPGIRKTVPSHDGCIAAAVKQLEQILKK